MRKISGLIAIIFSCLTAVVLIVAAYGGAVNPTVSTIPALISMTFPIIAPVAAVTAIILLFFKRIASLIIIFALLASYPQIAAYFPINFKHGDRQPLFTMMTYNTAHLKDFAVQGETSADNPTLKFILNQSADIVALQECTTFSQAVTTPVSDTLVDSLFTAYPHHTNGIEGQALLSKFPFEQIPLHHRPSADFQVRAYRIYMPADTFTLFNMHLKSIGLNHEDKTLYKDLTKGRTDGDGIKQEIKDIRKGLISKLSAAFKVRVNQAELVKELIDSIGGKVIVCGDFNDVPECYAIRTISSVGLKDAYRQAALGPTITFHEDRFYFRIDHILYRGFEPLSTECITVPHSDHYPLVASFTGEK